MLDSIAKRITENHLQHWRAVMLGIILFTLSLLTLPPLPSPTPTPGAVIERSGDYAVAGLDVAYAKQALLLTGPYSRFSFNHPSPFLAYWYAAFEATGLFESGFAAYEIAQAIWNLIWISGAAAAMYWMSKSLLGILAIYAATFCILPFANPPWLTDLWGPATILTPTLALIVSAAAVMSGHRRFLPLTVAAGCGAVSSHIGGLPVVAMVLPLAAIHALRHSTSAERRRMALPLLLVIGYFFALPLLDILTSKNLGNLGRLISFFGKDRQDLGAIAGLGFIWEQLSAPSLRAGLGSALWWLAPLTVSVITSWTLQSRGARALALCVALAWVGVSIASARIVAPPEGYLLWSLWSIVIATSTVPLLAVLSGRLLGSRLISGTLAALLLLAFLNQLRIIPRVGDVTAHHPESFVSFIRALPPPVELRPATPDGWDAVAIVARALLAHGAEIRGAVCVPRRWQFMYRSILACQARPRTVLRAWRTADASPELLEAATEGRAASSNVVTIERVEVEAGVPKESRR